MEKVAVLLSTYNGEKFLKEQIESILNQNGVEPILFVRDDGSKDSTQQILKAYADEGKLIWMNEGENHNLGFRDSFLLLLKEAYNRFLDVQYFSFADQDDVWMENKLIAAVEKLNQCDCAKGKLYYSNKLCVDSDLKILHKENTRFYDDFMETLWYAMASGCTMVFDRVLAELSIRNSPSVSKYHDSWVYRIAKCVGSKIIFDENANIMYRQHGNNVIGEEAMKQGRKLSLKQIIIRVLPTKIDDRHVIQRTLLEIYEKYKNDFTPEAEYWMKTLQHYDKSLKLKCRLLFNPMIRKRGGWKNRIRWAAKVVFNML